MTSVDCKTVGFFLKISKEIAKSLTRAKRVRRDERKKTDSPYFWRLSPVSLSVFSLIPDLLFDCSRVLEYAKIRTVLQSMTSVIDLTTGECWAGHSGQHDYTLYGLDYDGCIEDDYQPCTANSRYCVGKHFSNMVFQIGMFYCSVPCVCMFGVLSGLTIKNLSQKAKC